MTTHENTLEEQYRRTPQWPGHRSHYWRRHGDFYGRGFFFFFGFFFFGSYIVSGVKVAMHPLSLVVFPFAGLALSVIGIRLKNSSNAHLFSV